MRKQQCGKESVTREGQSTLEPVCLREHVGGVACEAAEGGRSQTRQSFAGRAKEVCNYSKPCGTTAVF